MAEYIQRLYQGRPLSSVGELLFVVAADQSAIVKHMEAVNVEPLGGLSDSITFWVVGAPETVPVDENIWIPETEIGPGERVTWGGGDTMGLETDVEVWAAVLLGSSAVINVLITGMIVDEPPP